MTSQTRRPEDDHQGQTSKRLHLDELWDLLGSAQEQNVSLYKAANLKAGGASAGSCYYWQHKLNAMYFRRAKMTLCGTEGPTRLSITTDSSAHSCSDTLLSIFFDFRNNTACYAVSPQMWPGKIIAANDDVAVETEEIERILARREQSRFGTYKLAQALSHQLELQCGKELAAFLVPEDLRPLLKPGNAQDRVVTERQCVKINGGDEIDVLKATREVPLVTFLVDQASTDMSLASFLQEVGFFACMDYDPFHRVARDQKLASGHNDLSEAQLASQRLWQHLI